MPPANPLQGLQNSQVPQPAPVLSNTPPSPRSKKVWILVSIVALTVLIIGIIGFFYINNTSSNSGVVPSPTSPVALSITPIQTTAPSPVVRNPIIELILEKGKKILIPDSDVEIEYMGADIPNQNCVDCSTTTDLVLTQKGTEKKLQYLCGGIAGTCTDKLSAYGFNIELVTASEISATVKILKQ